jgi:hypothetical protein
MVIYLSNKRRKMAYFNTKPPRAARLEIITCQAGFEK